MYEVATEIHIAKLHDKKRVYPQNLQSHMTRNICIALKFSNYIIHLTYCLDAMILAKTLVVMTILATLIFLSNLLPWVSHTVASQV